MRYYSKYGDLRVAYHGEGKIRIYKPQKTSYVVNPQNDEIEIWGDDTISNKDILLEIAKDYAKTLNVFKQGIYKIKSKC